jgi:hypothetical protein
MARLLGEGWKHLSIEMKRRLYRKMVATTHKMIDFLDIIHRPIFI